MGGASSAIQSRSEPRPGGHHAIDAGVPPAIAADVDPHRIPAIGLPREVAGQDHAGAEVDRPAVERRSGAATGS